MGEELQTTRFERTWHAIRNRGEVEATATFSTIRGQMADEPPDGLPRVDHLLALGEILGVGSSGEVVSAEQHSLHRTIAVKRPRGADGIPGRLLREARVIGHLEHPNIPPVHFVGSGANEELLVGLKRVEGETLTDRLARQKPGECLDENLEILIHICNAVGYAHARGIVHLDLKPDNIMTGHFGEVYVLDWGLAAAYRDEAAIGIPHVREEKDVRGTPAFIAPELITLDAVTPATDVYLLGGLLHYFLMHEPPNAGGTTLEAMQSAFDPPATRTFPAHVPEYLAQMCRRALAANPADRFPDADAFRAALVDFRHARRAIEARDVALSRISDLYAVLDGGQSAPAVYQAYGAARQALDAAERAGREAPSETPDDDLLLQEVLERVIGWELDRDNLGGAELLIADLPRPNDALRERATALRARQSSAHVELENLRREVDLNIGARSKAFLALAIGVTVAMLEVVSYLLDIPRTPPSVLAGYFVYLAVLTATTFALRRRILSTLTNRGLTLAVWQMSLAGFALRIGAYFDMMPLHAALGYDLTVVTLGGLQVGLGLERRTLLIVPVYAIAAGLCFALPQFSPVIFGTAHLLGLGTLSAVLWAASRNARASAPGR